MDEMAVGSEALGFLTLDEAAVLLRLSLSTVKKLCYSRELESVKVGTRRLVPPEAIAAYKQKLRDEAAAAAAAAGVA